MINLASWDVDQLLFSIPIPPYAPDHKSNSTRLTPNLYSLLHESRLGDKVWVLSFPFLVTSLTRLLSPCLLFPLTVLQHLGDTSPPPACTNRR